MPQTIDYRGIIPAIACPFTADDRIDEPALRQLAPWLAGHEGVVAVMTNGHTGEVFSLTPLERAEVTRIVCDELRGRVPVISSVVCEGLVEAADHARLARAAGADALDVMPPHPDKLLQQGLIVGGGSMDDFAKFERDDMAKSAKIVADVGIRAE